MQKYTVSFTLGYVTILFYISLANSPWWIIKCTTTDWSSEGKNSSDD